MEGAINSTFKKSCQIWQNKKRSKRKKYKYSTILEFVFRIPRKPPFPAYASQEGNMPDTAYFFARPIP